MVKSIGKPGSNFNSSVSKITRETNHLGSLGLDQLEFSQGIGSEDQSLAMRSFRSVLSPTRPKNNNHFKVLSSVKKSHLKTVSNESIARVPLVYEIYENSINEKTRENLSKEVHQSF